MKNSNKKELTNRQMHIVSNNNNYSLGYKYYLFSDVHLEKFSEKKTNEFIAALEDICTKNKQVGIKTVFLFCGDMGELADHNILDWSHRLDAQVLYVPGNHEYWNSDYFAKKQELSQWTVSNKDSNTTVLLEDFTEVGDYLFVGTTLWSDVGLSLNPDLTPKALTTMLDSHQIKAQAWYTPENENKLKSISDNYYIVERLISEKSWNVLIEQEENKKAVDFLNALAHVSLLLNTHKEKLEHYSKSEKLFVSEKVLNVLDKTRLLNNFTCLDWIALCKSEKVLGYNDSLYDIDHSKADLYEQIFNKLIKLDFTKQWVVLSHHLPYLEQNLAIYSNTEIKDEDTEPENRFNILEKAISPLYAISRGLNDYNKVHPNYFYRCSKHEFDRELFIARTIHYANNGAANFTGTLISKLSQSIWCHGHDHHKTGDTFVKGLCIKSRSLGAYGELDAFLTKSGNLCSIELSRPSEKLAIDHDTFLKLSDLSEMEELIPTMMSALAVLKEWVEALPGVKSKIASDNDIAGKYLTVQNKQIFYEKINNINWMISTVVNQLDMLDKAFALANDIEFKYSHLFLKLYGKTFTYGLTEDVAYRPTYFSELAQLDAAGLLRTDLIYLDETVLYYLNKQIEDYLNLLSNINTNLNSNDIPAKPDKTTEDNSCE